MSVRRAKDSVHPWVGGPTSQALKCLSTGLGHKMWKSLHETNLHVRVHLNSPRIPSYDSVIRVLNPSRVLYIIILGLLSAEV